MDLKCQVTFASTANKSDLSIDFGTHGVRAESIRLNHNSFDTFIKDLRPDLVLFDRFLTEEQFGWRVTECVPRALRILDTEDLHSLRQVRQKAFISKKAFSTSLWLQDDLTIRELASIYRCDLSLIISSFEIDLLNKVLTIPDELVLHLPFLLEKIDNEIQVQWPPYESRKDFVFIGNGRHAPNVDAIGWLKSEIWPIIRKKLPEVQLLIYGAYLPEAVYRMHNPQQGFLVQGQVDNVQHAMASARINLAPLRFGAGIKGKLCDAMISGTPNITTGIGSEGMHGTLPWGGVIADGAELFAKTAIQLYTEESDWLNGQKKGIAIINSLYDKNILYPVLKLRLEMLGKNLDEHRNRNFVGRMLAHQTMQSTKYLSKWIEAKNKYIA